MLRSFLLEEQFPLLEIGWELAADGFSYLYCNVLGRMRPLGPLLRLLSAFGAAELFGTALGLLEERREHPG